MIYPSAASAFAPGSIGNFGPGLDCLGCAVSGAGDRVEATWSDEPRVEILEPGRPELPRDPSRHSAGIAAMAVVRAATSLGVTSPARGIALRVTKGLPLAGGQGGSAASAVAGACAVNALLGAPLDRDAVLRAALEAEAAVAGRHLDNVAPSLLGGIILIRSLSPIDLVSLPVPNALRIVLAYPAQQLRTAEARIVLPELVSREIAVHQMAQVGAIAAALAAGDLALLGRAIDDRIAEPRRVELLPGFAEAKQAAMDAGALGCSISGAGPTAFALTSSDEIAARVASAMRAGYARRGVRADLRVARVDVRGTQVKTSSQSGAAS
jgi:homoserine kinase